MTTGPRGGRPARGRLVTVREGANGDRELKLGLGARWILGIAAALLVSGIVGNVTMYGMIKAMEREQEITRDRLLLMEQQTERAKELDRIWADQEHGKLVTQSQFNATVGALQNTAGRIEALLEAHRDFHEKERR